MLNILFLMVLRSFGDLIWRFSGRLRGTNWMVAMIFDLNYKLTVILSRLLSLTYASNSLLYWTSVSPGKLVITWITGPDLESVIHFWHAVSRFFLLYISRPAAATKAHFEGLSLVCAHKSTSPNDGRWRECQPRDEKTSSMFKQLNHFNLG